MRVDASQTSFLEGREFRVFHEFSLAAGASQWLRFVVPLDVVIYGRVLTVVQGNLRFALSTGGGECEFYVHSNLVRLPDRPSDPWRSESPPRGPPAARAAPGVPDFVRASQPPRWSGMVHARLARDSRDAGRLGGGVAGDLSLYHPVSFALSALASLSVIVHLGILLLSVRCSTMRLQHYTGLTRLSGTS